MVKKGKKNKSIFLTAFLVILVLGIGYLAVTQSVGGVDSGLDYKDEWYNQDLKTGSYSTEATLKLPEGTSLFSFTPDYDFKTYKKDGGDVKIEVRYEVFNYNTNSWEVTSYDNWDMRNDYGEQNKFLTDGESVYNTGMPEHLESNRVAKKEYIRYYGCLEGMNINEARELSPWIEGTSSYSYRCLYPGESILKHEYGDDSNEDWDLEYFPKLITLGTEFIKDNKVLFRISVNIKSSGIDSIGENDFEIDLWKVETTTVDTYHYSEREEICGYQSKYTYQVSGEDYFTRNECNYQNSVIDCYKDSHCACNEDSISECQEGKCICEKKSIIDIIFPDEEELDDEELGEIFPDGEEPVSGQVVIDKINPLSYIIPIIILTLIILVIRNIARKRNK